MTITREQVADLREGDVVEITRDEWPEGSVVRGPISRSSDYDGGALYILDGHFGVVNEGGTPYLGTRILTVISRAPRPLYVNHDRSEPVPGDVVRDAGDPLSRDTWLCTNRLEWITHTESVYDREDLPSRLRLLVDGETGQVVP